MAICLDYQTVYARRREMVVSMRLQVIAGMLLLAVLSFKVWVKVQTTDIGYELARSREQVIALDMQRRELELQLSVLSRADTLSQMAEGRLGLAALNPRQARKVSVLK